MKHSTKHWARALLLATAGLGMAFSGSWLEVARAQGSSTSAQEKATNLQVRG